MSPTHTGETLNIFGFLVLVHLTILQAVSWLQLPKVTLSGEGKVTLVAFVWLFSTVRFQMCPQSISWRWCKVTLVAIVRGIVNCVRHCELCAALWIVRGIVRSQLCEEVMVWSPRTNKGRYRKKTRKTKQQNSKTTKQQQQQKNNNKRTTTKEQQQNNSNKTKTTKQKQIITNNNNNNKKTRYSTKTTFVKNCVRHCTLWKRLCHIWESSQVGRSGR